MSAGQAQSAVHNGSHFVYSGPEALHTCSTPPGKEIMQYYKLMKVCLTNKSQAFLTRFSPVSNLWYIFNTVCKGVNYENAELLKITLPNLA